MRLLAALILKDTEGRVQESPLRQRQPRRMARNVERGTAPDSSPGGQRTTQMIEGEKTSDIVVRWPEHLFEAPYQAVWSSRP